MKLWTLARDEPSGELTVVYAMQDQHRISFKIDIRRAFRLLWRQSDARFALCFITNHNHPCKLCRRWTVGMKCNLCGHGRLVQAAYCPNCGSPVLKNKRQFVWELVWVTLALAFLFWLSFR
jgi:hypothetical protein